LAELSAVVDALLAKQQDEKGPEPPVAPPA
jgi:hypothetical protein